jgi:glutamate racemase
MERAKDIMDTSPIGVFDSGVGGLTVVRALRERLPHESIIYLGDTARVPYGNRGAETVRRYAINASHLLAEQGVKALVIACNTATAYALPALEEAFALPVLGVVRPVAAQAAARSHTGHIAVIGTRGTIASGCYAQALAALRPDATLHPIACPLFVPLAEEGWLDGAVPEQVAATYLEPLFGGSVDTLILGCTHYPLLRPTIAHVLDQRMGRDVALLDSGRATAEACAARLEAEGLSAPADQVAALRLLVTDDPQGFAKIAVRFFGQGVPAPEHVNILDRFAHG